MTVFAVFHGAIRLLPPRLAGALVVCALAAFAPAAADAQEGPLPPGFAAALEDAMAAGEAAGRNAAISAGLVGNPARDEIAQRTRQRIQESSVVDVVVGAIRQRPGSVATIVRAAIRRAPAYREAIVYRASLAFPAFTPFIRAAASRP